LDEAGKIIKQGKDWKKYITNWLSISYVIYDF
jgi:hypothetical protein